MWFCRLFAGRVRFTSWFDDFHFPNSKHVGLLWWIPHTASVEITFQVESKEWRSATGVRPYQTYQRDQGAREPALEALGGGQMPGRCCASTAICWAVFSRQRKLTSEKTAIGGSKISRMISELTLVLHLFAYWSLKLETTNHQPLVHLAPQHGDVGESGLGQLLAAGHAPLQPRFFLTSQD